MREGWEYKKLGEVATYINGYAFKPEQWKVDGTPIIRIQNLNNPDAPYNYYEGEVPDKVKVYKGDLLISWSASLGAYIWEGETAYLNQHIFKVYFDKSNIDKMYLKYAVSSKLDVMIGQVHGATMKHIVKKDFDNTLIPYPHITMQLSIVSELDKITEMISKYDEQLKELDKLSQSIFYEMFGDPLENEKGWEVKKIVEIADATIGLTYKPENVADNGVIVLRSGNIQNSALDFTDILRVETNIPSHKYVKDGDILMCTRNGSLRHVGKVAIIKNLNEQMTYGAFMTVIRSEMNPYLYGYFNTPAFRDSLIHGKTTTINQITVKMLNETSLPIPPLPLQQSFARKIEAIEAMKSKVKEAKKEAETLLAARMQYWFE